MQHQMLNRKKCRQKMKFRIFHIFPCQFRTIFRLPGISTYLIVFVKPLNTLEHFVGTTSIHHKTGSFQTILKDSTTRKISVHILAADNLIMDNFPFGVLHNLQVEDTDCRLS